MMLEFVLLIAALALLAATLFVRIWRSILFCAVIAIVAYFLFPAPIQHCLMTVPGDVGSKICQDAEFANYWPQLTGYPEVVGFLVATMITVWWSKRNSPTST
jgi:hypothetical protein